MRFEESFPGVYLASPAVQLVVRQSQLNKAKLHGLCETRCKKKEHTQAILTVYACPVAGHYIVEYEPGARREVFSGVSSEAELHMVCG